MRNLTFLLGFIFCTVAQAQVYRWVDEQGNVHYSDRAQSGADKISVPTGAVAEGAAAKGAASKTQSSPDTDTETVASGYEQFAIVAPADNETITNDQNQVLVSLLLKPGLQQEHTIRLRINDEEQSQPIKTTQFILTQMSAGTYALQATVHDADGERLSATQTVQFHFKPGIDQTDSQ